MTKIVIVFDSFAIGLRGKNNRFCVMGILQNLPIITISKRGYPLVTA